MKVLFALRTAGPSRCLGDHVKWRSSRDGKIESQGLLPFVGWRISQFRSPTHKIFSLCHVALSKTFNNSLVKVLSTDGSLYVLIRVTNSARENHISVGTCIGKFTKTKRFRLHVTALDFMAPYAKVSWWFFVIIIFRPVGQKIHTLTLV